MHTHRILPSILGIALLGLASGLASAADAPQENPPAETNWLSALKLSGIEQGWGEARSNRSVDNQRLTVAGRGFERGIGTHANSSIPLELDGNGVELSGWAGLDDETGGRWLGEQPMATRSISEVIGAAAQPAIVSPDARRNSRCFP